MKRVFLFLVKQLLLAGVCYLILISYCNSNYFSEEAKDIAFEIVSGNTEDHSVVLKPDPATIKGWGRKRVTWSIGSTATTVKSFRIEKKGESPQLFQWINREPRKQTRKGNGRLKNIRQDTVYVYSIIWEDNMGNPTHIFDPKIAVKPSPNRLLEQLIYIVYALLAILISFQTFRNK